MNCHGKEAQRQGMRVQGEDRFAEMSLEWSRQTSLRKRIWDEAVREGGKDGSWGRGEG